MEIKYLKRTMQGALIVMITIGLTGCVLPPINGGYGYHSGYENYPAQQEAAPLWDAPVVPYYGGIGGDGYYRGDGGGDYRWGDDERGDNRWGGDHRDR